MASALRKQLVAGALDNRREQLALADVADIPLQRAPHLPLLQRCWELREYLTAYDAAYVALAEALAVTLLTADTRIARAPGLRCQVEVLQSAPSPMKKQF